MKKRFRDLLPEEARALTEDEIDQYVDLECAYSGVPLMSDLPIEPAEVDAKPDLMAYSVGGIYVRTEAVADSLADILNDTEQVETYYLQGHYSYSGPMGIRTPDPDDRSVKVSTSRYWSPEHYDKHRVTLERYKVLKEKYEEAKKEYDKTAERRKEVSDGIVNIIEDLHRVQRMRDSIKNEFTRYFELADENHEIALTFLIDSHRWPEETVREVLGVPSEVNA